MAAKCTIRIVKHNVHNQLHYKIVLHLSLWTPRKHTNATIHNTHNKNTKENSGIPLALACGLAFALSLSLSALHIPMRHKLSSRLTLAFPRTLARTQAPVERVIAIPQIHSVLLAIIFPHLLLQTNRSNKNLPSIYTQITSCTPSVKSTTASLEAELVAPRE